MMTSQPPATDRDTARSLYDTWSDAIAEYHRTSSPDAELAEQTAFDALVDHCDATGLTMTEYDPRNTTQNLRSVECLLCGYVEDKPYSVEVWNEYGECPNPAHPLAETDDEQRTLWTMRDGTATYLETVEGVEQCRIDFLQDADA